MSEPEYLPLTLIEKARLSGRVKVKLPNHKQRDKEREQEKGVERE